MWEKITQFYHSIILLLLLASSASNEKHRHAKRARVIFLVIGSRSIRRTVHSNDLVKFFGGGCDVQQEGNWKSIICKYNVTCTSVMVR